MHGFLPHETFQLLVETGGTERASTLLMAASRAFAGNERLSQGDTEQFEVLATRLFPCAEPGARGIAAKTLAGAAALTPTLEELVVDNLGDERTDFLVGAVALSTATMLKLVDDGDVEAAAALARRSDLPGVVLAKLFRTNSRRVFRALAANTAIPISGRFLAALARAAQMDPQIAWSLAARDDFDAALLAPAFFDLQDRDRLRVVAAFARRPTPQAPISRYLEATTIRGGELADVLMGLFADDRRGDVAHLLEQITGLDEARCAAIADDAGGAALFVVLRAFRCTAKEGLKVVIHALRDRDPSQTLPQLAALFEQVEPAAMAYLMSAWRGEANLAELLPAEHRPFTQPSRRTPERPAAGVDPMLDWAIAALTRKAG